MGVGFGADSLEDGVGERESETLFVDLRDLGENENEGRRGRR